MTRVSSCDRSLSQHFPAGSLVADRGSSSHTFRVKQGHRLEVIVCFQQLSHQWNSIVSVQEAETQSVSGNVRSEAVNIWVCLQSPLQQISFSTHRTWMLFDCSTETVSGSLIHVMWSDVLQLLTLCFHQSFVWWVIEIQTILVWWRLCFDLLKLTRLHFPQFATAAPPFPIQTLSLYVSLFIVDE